MEGLEKKILLSFMQEILNLRVHMDKQLGQARKKPLLILLLLSKFEKGLIKNNIIKFCEIRKELSFLIKEYDLRPTKKRGAGEDQPFVFLASSSIWEIVSERNISRLSDISLSILKEPTTYGKFRDDYFEMLKNSPKARKIIIETILNKWWSKYFHKKILNDLGLEKFYCKSGGENNMVSSPASFGSEKIEEWEAVIEKLIMERKIFGALDLVNGQWEKFKELVEKSFKRGEIFQKAPLSFSFFLVWVGVEGYQDGNFWPLVFSNLSTENSISLQRKIGEHFLRTLEKFDLPFNIPHANKYVTPILSHAIIPNFYMEGFFQYVLWKFTKEETDRVIVDKFLKKGREIYLKKEEIQKKEIQLEEKERNLEEKRILLNNWNDFQKLTELEKQKIKNEEMDILMEFPLDFLEKKKIKKEEIEKLKEKSYEIEDLEKSLEKINEKLEINWVKIFDKELFSLDSVNELLKNFPEEKQRIMVEDYQALPSIIKQHPRTVFSKLISFLFYSIAKRKRDQLEKDLEKYVEGFLELREPFKTSFLGKIGVLKEIRGYFHQYKKKEILLEEKRKINLQEEHYPEKGKEGENLDVSINNIKKQISNYERLLMAVGKGSIEEGKEIVKEQKDIRKQYNVIKGEMGPEIYPDQYLDEFAIVFDTMETKEKLGEIVDKERKELEKEKLELTKDSQGLSSPLYFLNEGSRIFFFFGEETALNLLYSTVKAIDYLKRDLDLPTEGFPFFPQRFRLKLASWWEEKGKEEYNEEKSRKEREKYITKPVVFFDEHEGKVGLIVRETMQKEGKEATLKISSDDNSFSKEINLVVKKERDGEFRTKEKKIKEIPPEKDYKIEFLWGEIHETWSIDFLRGIRVLLFDNSGLQISEDKIKEKPYWIITSKHNKIQNEEEIIAMQKMSGRWKDYIGYYFDFGKTDIIIIEDIKGERFYLKKEDLLNPNLSGGKLLKGGGELVLCNNLPVYSKRMPLLTFSPKEFLKNEDYSIRIITSNGEKEVLDLGKDGFFDEGKNIFELRIDELTKEEYGLVEVFLEEKGLSVFSEKFYFLPELEIEFDKEYYVKRDNEKRIIKIKKSDNSNLKFIPEKPTEKIGGDRSKEILRFSSWQGFVEGILEIKNQELPFKIKIPLLNCFNDGLEIEKQELWFEDLGILKIELPRGLENEIELLVNKGEQKSSKKLIDGSASFDLQTFSDTVSSFPKSVVPFYLFFKTLNKTEFLFQVRTKWEVVNFAMDQKIEGNKRIIKLTWEDRGKPKNRIIKLKQLNVQNPQELEYKIEDGAQLHFIEEPLGKIPFGKYEVKFNIDDLWDFFEEETSDNSNKFLINVGTVEEAEKNILNFGFQVVSFEAKGKKHQVDYLKINVFKINPDKQIEEKGFYVGEVTFKEPSSALIGKSPNPVYFYINFENEYLTYLTDKDDDGIMFCPKCKKVVWQVDADRDHFIKDHLEPETIFILIFNREEQP